MILGEEEKSKYKIEYIGEKFYKDLKAYKIIVIGIFGVGKTTTIHKLMGKEIDKEYSPTMSVDIKNIQVKVNDKIIQLNIWDCCGNDKFALNTPNLFRNVSIGIIIFAVNNKKSFEDLEKWYNMLKKHSEGSIIFLIGNKIDLEKEREVEIKDIEVFKNKYVVDIKIFMETSALYGENMDKLLDNIAITIYEKDKTEENQLENALKKTVTLVKEDFAKKDKKKKKKCC